MPILRQLLETAPYPLLCVIARQRSLNVPHNCPKADLVALAEQGLSEPERLQATLDALSPAERAVLEDLRLAGGRLPRYHVARRHGELRRYRPWQDHAPDRPWEHPRSPTEHLYFLGLIFWEKATRDLVIPEDLLAHYPAPERPVAIEAPAPDAFPTPMVAAHDLAQLLALLEVTQTRLLHGRWLPPRFLRTWGERCVRSPANADAGSELRIGRRRFLHFGGEVTGLMAPVGPYLKPTPAAWTWLASNPLARFGALWDGVTGASDERWRLYRLPGHGLLRHPSFLIPAVLQALRQDVIGALQETDEVTLDRLAHLSLGTPESFAGRLLARDPDLRSDLRGETWEPDERLSAAIVALVGGPLRWLGAVDVEPESGLRLTPWGAHWLHPRAPRPAFPSPLPFTLDPPLTFTPPEGLPDLSALMTLAACAERLPDGRFRVTQESFVGALHRGHESPALLDRLDRVAHRPLTGEERRQTTTWDEFADRMVIRRLTVLEVEDPAILARLSAARRGRSHVVRTLGRRAAVVDAGRLPVLVRRLTKQEGAPPRVEAPPAEPAPSARPGAGLGRGGAAHSWLAVRVYRALARWLDLPVHVPHELVERLASIAEPSALAAADVAVERTLEALQDAIEGRAAFPARTEPVLPVAESVALIEQALAEGYALEMDYYTAGRDVVTHRVVEPHRLEYRGEVAYLVGYCRRAQAERVFRVDRIRSLEPVPLPEERYTGWDV